MNSEPDHPQPPMTWPHNLDELHIQALGQSLRRIDTGMMKAGEAQVGQRVWYQGQEPYFDVVLQVHQNGAGAIAPEPAPEFPGASLPASSQPTSVPSADRAIADGILWCQFTLRGKVLLWSRDPARLQTGETEEFDVPPMLAYYAASKTIRDGAEVDRAFVHLASRILKSRLDDPLLQAMGTILAHPTP